ncbi:MAG: DUF4337 domain-containing protein [Alphaproteobacteria bacterium]|nr:DUF4337 domain-containing protein [Alphaproteobacteria bacterium]
MEEELESPFKAHHEEAAEEAMESGGRWLSRCAVLSALLAAAAAVTGLYSGHYVNGAMLEQIQASDQWNYYQAKGIKAVVHEAAGNADKSQHYRQEQDAIKQKADGLTETSMHHFEKHEQLAAAVTFFQIAIALTAIAVLTRRRHFLGVVGVLAAAGCVFAVRGFAL